MRPDNNKHRGCRLPGLSAAPQGGFALVAALLACMVLLALGMLVIHLSTQDLRVSAKVMGDKKALAAAETGIHKMVQNFNPENLAASPATNIQVDAANDPATRYTIGTPAANTTVGGSGTLEYPGYNISGGVIWVQKLYDVTVTGENTAYGTHVDIGVGLGYGPVDSGLVYP